MSLTNQIAEIIRKTGSDENQKSADMLELQNNPVRSLHLRKLNLNADLIKQIGGCFENMSIEQEERLTSLSFSYNPKLGDEGALLLVKHLPKGLSELGMVGCGLKDEGGYALLNWAKENPRLQMLCIEQNQFSDTLKADYAAFKIQRPEVLLVV